MKVVLSIEALSPQLTGIGRYAWELVQRLPLHPEVEDTRFFRSGRWVIDPHQLLAPAVGTGISNAIATAGKPKVLKLSKLPKWLRLPHWAHQQSMARACKDRVFHGPNFFLPQCADRGVITVHDLSVFKFPETHPAARVKQFERDFADSVARSVHVITDSQTTRLEVMAFTGLAADRVTSIALGVSAAYRPFADEALALPLRPYGLVPRSYGLCVSTLEPRKKIEQLINAWEHLPTALRSVCPLVLAGSQGWLSEGIQARISQATAQGWLRYVGYVPEADMPELYAGARVFVYPSTYEGFGLPPIEAMACGVPVVVADSSCLPEVTQGAALTVNPDDVLAFTIAVEKSLTDNVWRAGAITAGRQVAATYTWQQCIDDTVKVYRRVITKLQPGT